MLKYLGIIISLLLTSFYLFPFEPAFMPGVNVKYVMACLSIPFVCMQTARKRDSKFDKDLLTIFLYSLPISLFSWISNVYNATYDYSFNYYFVSIFAWMGAAYLVVSVIKYVHNALSIKLVANYLIGVCCLQCVLSQIMVYNPAIGNFIDGLMATGGEAFMGDAGDRIHGLGCALDVAGGRFAAILLMNAFLMTKAKTRIEIYFHTITFLIIAVLGNMIGRTTSIGVIMCVAYWCYDALSMGRVRKEYINHLGILLLIAIPIMVILYNTNDVFYKNLRFGFEGFFALAEKGKWDMNSTNILTQNMVVFPDNMKTWIIGDGYGANPYYDPYYVGPAYHGFYMGTDIGYLRFIFFFGILGMLSMITMFICFYRLCCNRFAAYRKMILLLLVLNLLIWLKVTSDLLPIFAIILCISKEENEEYERLCLSSEE